MHYCEGYRHFKERVVHLYTECPDGSQIGIARGVAVNIADAAVMRELGCCPWCFEKAGRENPPPYGLRVI